MTTTTSIARIQNCAVRNPKRLVKSAGTTYFLYVGGHMYLCKALSKNYQPGRVAQWQVTRLGDYPREYILVGTSTQIAAQLS
jgi:hypothetical protein